MPSKKRWVTPTFESTNCEPERKRVICSRNRYYQATFSEPVNKDRTLSWLEKYQPSTPEDLIIHPKKVKEVEEWFKNYISFNIEKFLLITGPCGCGKTSTLRVLSKQFQFDIIEWITPLDREYDPEILGEDQDYQNRKNIFDYFLSRATRYPSLLSTAVHKLILVKDVPNTFIRNSDIFHELIRKYLHVNTFPIVFICSDDQISRNLFPDTLRKECNIKTINFNPITSKSVVKVLQRVLDLERMSNPDLIRNHDINLDYIYQNTSGDLRSALLKLHLTAVKDIPLASVNNKKIKIINLETKSKDESIDLFHILGRVLYAKRESSSYSKFVHDPDEIVNSVCMQPSTFVGFLQENYISRFSSIKSVTAASNCLSLADILLTSYNTDLNVTALIVAIRGLMVANEDPVKSFKPFVKPRVRDDLYSFSIRNELRENFPAFQGHSDNDILLYTLPLLNKCNFLFEEVGQTRLANKLGNMFCK